MVSIETTATLYGSLRQCRDFSCLLSTLSTLSTLTFKETAMHSHERTLVSSLSSPQANSREPLHDLACNYICQDPVITRVVRKLVDVKVPSDMEVEEETCFRPEVEYMLTRKGRTVGFVDVRVAWMVKLKSIDGKYRRPEETEKHGRIYIEVKTEPCQIGSVLRQLRLYQSVIEEETPFSFGHNSKAIYALATTYPLEPSQAALLRRCLAA